MDLKKWELGVVIAALILFFGSLAAYLTGIPLRRYLFGIEDEEGQQLIGKVTQSTGTVRREILSAAEFNSIGTGDPLFRHDVVMTDNASTAVLKLDDGSTIQLGPKSMVKLQTEAGFDLTGVNRTTRVEVVSGEVTGNSAGGKSRVILASHDGNIRLGRKASRTVRVADETPDAILARARQASAPRSGFFSGMSFTSLLQKIEGSESLHPAGISGTSRSNSSQNLSRSDEADDPTEREPDFNFKEPPDPTRPLRSIPSPLPSPEITPSPSPSPSPTPSPKPARIELQLLDPSADAALTVPQGNLFAAMPVAFQWRLAGARGDFAEKANATARLTVWADASGGRPKKILLQKELRCHAGISKVDWVADSPGSYEWEVRLSQPELKATASEARAKFRVNKDFEGIAVSPPEQLKIADAPKSESWMERSKPRVRLRWPAYPTATEYEVTIFHPNSKKGESRHTRETTLTVTQSSIVDAELTYEVTSALPNGFVVHSGRKNLLFNFTPPDPVTPPDQTTLSKSVDAWNDNGVLLTWQKTGISEGYELEISRDPAFRRVVVKRSQTDNFFLFWPRNADGTYWWRIRAYAKKQFTRPSAVFRFNISTK